MKKLLPITLLLLIATFSFAQTQRGYVKTKGRMVDGKLVHGQGLKGASVSVHGRSAVLVKGDDGAFSFTVTETQFRLDSVRKKGYQLVDMDALSKTYRPSLNPIYLVMETPEQQLQDKLDTERKIRRNMQRKLEEREDEIESLYAKQKMDREEYQQALNKLYADQQNNEMLISEMAKAYSRIDYDQIDELNQRISDAILNGRLTEADSLLRSKGDMNSRIAEIRKEQQLEAKEEAEMAQRQQNLQTSKEGTQKKLEDVAADCYKFYNRFKLANQHDSAAYYIELRAELDTINAKWQYNAGYYYEEQNQHKKAEIYYARALEIFRQLAAANPQAYEPDLAHTLNNLAILYSKTQRFTESEEMYKEALEIFRRLAATKPQAYEPNVAMTLNNLANLYYLIKHFTESEAMHKETLEIYQRLAATNPQAYEPDVASALNNLAILYTNKQRYTKRKAME